MKPDRDKDSRTSRDEARRPDFYETAEPFRRWLAERLNVDARATVMLARRSAGARGFARGLISRRRDIRGADTLGFLALHFGHKFASVQTRRLAGERLYKQPHRLVRNTIYKSLTELFMSFIVSHLVQNLQVFLNNVRVGQTAVSAERMNFESERTLTLIDRRESSRAKEFRQTIWLQREAPLRSRSRIETTYNNLETRLLDRFEGRTLDRLETRLLDRFGGRTLDRFETRWFDRFKERTVDRFETRLFDRFEGRTLDRFETRLFDRFEGRTLDRFERQTGDRLETRLLDRLERRTGDRLETRISDRFESRYPGWFETRLLDATFILTNSRRSDRGRTLIRERNTSPTEPLFTNVLNLALVKVPQIRNAETKSPPPQFGMRADAAPLLRKAAGERWPNAAALPGRESVTSVLMSRQRSWAELPWAFAKRFGVARTKGARSASDSLANLGALNPRTALGTLTNEFTFLGRPRQLGTKVSERFTVMSAAAEETRKSRLASELVGLHKGRIPPPPLGFVFVQPPRHSIAENPAINRVETREIVELVKNEVQQTMAREAPLASLTGEDYAEISDRVYSSLARRLTVERERLGLR